MSESTEKKPAEKKIPATSVYPITHNGAKRYVEAVSRAAAVVHAFKPHVGRPLSGGEVNALHRAGTKIELAGESA